jgi:Uri superfamily endonuclease
MANHEIQPGSGTYALFLVCGSVQEIQVGRLGRLRTKRGYYAYIGSAFGPGGISARVAHHSRLASRRHWHIDYLRQITRPLSCWYTHDSIRREHEWAACVAALPQAAIPLVGFGCSDCRCQSHLIWFPSPPPCRSFRETLGIALSDHDQILETSLA